MALIEIKDLKKSFANLEVLKGVNLEVNANEVVSIIGASGSGKSTLLRCINLLERAESGQIIYDGKNILEKGYDINNYRTHVSMVFQNFNLFENMSVIQNCTLGLIKVKHMDKTKANAIALEMLTKVGMEAFANNMTTQLSGGQKQRVAIARSLCMQPDVILFDEPTSALDPLMVSEVLQVMKEVAQSGMTMVIVTHEMQFAHEVSDKVVFMHEGKVEACGDANNIFESCDNIHLQNFLSRYRNH